MSDMRKTAAGRARAQLPLPLHRARLPYRDALRGGETPLPAAPPTVTEDDEEAG